MWIDQRTSFEIGQIRQSLKILSLLRLFTFFMFFALLLGLVMSGGDMFMYSSEEFRACLLTASGFLIVVLPVGAYVWISGRENFKFFSPYFFPLISFSLIYIVPSINLQYFCGDYIYPLALEIQLGGVSAYLAGVCVYSWFVKNTGPSVSISWADKFAVTLKEHRVSIIFFLVTGVTLLFLYGIISGVTFEMLQGRDVENLRRSAEIGKGVIKEPAIFFITVSVLWLLGKSLLDKGRLTATIQIILVAAAGIVFICTGHKSPACWILVYSLGVYNMYHKLNSLKILSVGSLFYLFIGILNIIRSGGSLDFLRVSQEGIFSYTGVYKANYVPIVRFVKVGILKLQWGAEYIQNAMIIIPRFFWPNKPVSFDYFLKEVLNLDFAGGGTPATVFGSLYLNFGFSGVLIGMFLLGVLYHAIYRCYLRSGNLLSSVMALYLLPAIINPALLLSTFLMLSIFIAILLASDRVSFGAVRKT